MMSLSNNGPLTFGSIFGHFFQIYKPIYKNIDLGVWKKKCIENIPI